MTATTEQVSRDLRLISLTGLWMVLIGLWRIPDMINDNNQDSYPAGHTPLWPRLASWLLLAGTLLVSMAWGRFLGRRQLRGPARISLFAAGFVTLVWCVVEEIHLEALVEHAEDHLAGLFFIGFCYVVMTVLGVASVGLAAGWASTDLRFGRRRSIRSIRSIAATGPGLRIAGSGWLLVATSWLLLSVYTAAKFALTQGHSQRYPWSLPVLPMLALGAAAVLGTLAWGIYLGRHRSEVMLRWSVVMASGVVLIGGLLGAALMIGGWQAYGDHSAPFTVAAVIAAVWATALLVLVVLLAAGWGFVDLADRRPAAAEDGYPFG